MIRSKHRWKSDDKSWFSFDIHPGVFWISALIIFSGVALTLIAGESAQNLFSAVQGWIATYTGWFYILVMNVVLIFCLWLMGSRYGKFRIGGKGAKPEFTRTAWFAMLFSAGMGIGLLFYGVAEPMFHLGGNPATKMLGIGSEEAAMAVTFLHWGFHPWAVYALVGLGLAFFGYTEGLPLSIRNVFYPLLGDRIHGWMGSVIDILATISCLYGVATSLGLGVQQVNAGLNHLFGIPKTTTVQVLLIAGITAIATWSVMKGLDAGIKKLSQINIVLALGFMLMVLILGPTLLIFNGLIENIGIYLQNFISLATWSEAYTETSWQDGWTIFYWGWWVAWSPFVGMFIARISRGRTVREYLAGVLLVPAGVTFLWLTVFGNTALYLEKTVGTLGAAVNSDISVALFKFLEHFPLSTVTSCLAILVIISFFVTSSDSGSMVIDIITAGGNPNPPKPQRLFWAVTEGVVAAVLLVGGGLSALQTAAITTGLPFALVLLLMCWSVHKGLKNYHRKQMKEKRQKEEKKLKALKEPTSVR